MDGICSVYPKTSSLAGKFVWPYRTLHRRSPAHSDCSRVPGLGLSPRIAPFGSCDPPLPAPSGCGVSSYRCSTCAFFGGDFEWVPLPHPPRSTRSSRLSPGRYSMPTAQARYTFATGPGRCGRFRVSTPSATPGAPCPRWKGRSGSTTSFSPPRARSRSSSGCGGNLRAGLSRGGGTDVTRCGLRPRGDPGKR